MNQKERLKLLEKERIGSIQINPDTLLSSCIWIEKCFKKTNKIVWAKSFTVYDIYKKAVAYKMWDGTVGFDIFSPIVLDSLSGSSNYIFVSEDFWRIYHKNVYDFKTEKFFEELKKETILGNFLESIGTCIVISKLLSEDRWIVKLGNNFDELDIFLYRNGNSLLHELKEEENFIKETIRAFNGDEQC